MFSIVLVGIAYPSWAKLGETEEQIVARYGEPVKIERQWPERIFTYKWGEYLVGVVYTEGKCERESYRHSEEKTPFTQAEIRKLLKMNSGGRDWHSDPKEWTLVRGTQVEARAWYFSEARYSLEVVTEASHKQWMEKLTNPTADLEWSGKELRFTSVLWLTHKEDGNCITLHSGPDVLEIPWSRRYLFRWVNLPVGKVCTVVVKDNENMNVEPLIAFRSDREHKSREAMAADFFSVYQLVRIQEADRVVWDRSICEVHHVKMNEITANIAYGTFLFEGADAICNERYPHHLDFAFGGDPVMSDDLNSPRVVQMYLCPTCVAECQIYKWLNPDLALDH